MQCNTLGLGDNGVNLKPIGLGDKGVNLKHIGLGDKGVLKHVTQGARW